MAMRLRTISNTMLKHTITAASFRIAEPVVFRFFLVLEGWGECEFRASVILLNTLVWLQFLVYSFNNK